MNIDSKPKRKQTYRKKRTEQFIYRIFFSVTKEAGNQRAERISACLLNVRIKLDTHCVCIDETRVLHQIVKTIQSSEFSKSKREP